MGDNDFCLTTYGYQICQRCCTARLNSSGDRSWANFYGRARFLAQSSVWSTPCRLIGRG